MDPVRRDYSIFNKFNFEHQPVGIKFTLNRPEGLERTDKVMPICRLFMEAQTGQPFYADKDNFACVDSVVLGMTEAQPIMASGQIGAKEKIYQEARANSRIYRDIQKIPKGTVRYAAFSPLDKMSFEPDILLITAKPYDAEIIFRALSYSLGKPIKSQITPVLMCAWLFSYPYVTGELNYSVTGIGYGIRQHKLLPEGLFLISVPYDLIAMLIENLQEMDWVLPMPALPEAERKEFSGKIMEQINQEYQNG
jgi:uncharacterized protein (DUF169 family)